MNVLKESRQQRPSWDLLCNAYNGKFSFSKSGEEFVYEADLYDARFSMLSHGVSRRDFSRVEGELEEEKHKSFI